MSHINIVLYSILLNLCMIQAGLTGCGHASHEPGEDAADDESISPDPVPDEQDPDMADALDPVAEDPAAEDLAADPAEDEADLPPEDPCRVNPDRYDGGSAWDLDPMSVEQDPINFPLTVQSGSMTSDSALVWGYTADNGSKKLMVWREPEDDGPRVLVRNITALPVEGYMKEALSGLAPGTWYHYGFFTYEGEDLLWRSMIGKFRTAIHDDCMEILTIGGTHGTNFRLAPYRSLEITSRFEMDAFFQLGDFSYNDGASTLDDFRQKWHMTLTDPGYMTLLPLVGQYIVWDDHEIEDNAQLYIDIVTNPALIAAGKNAFFETTPVPRHADGSYWRSYRWGLTAEMFILDCRHERRPETMLTENAIYISRAQMDWLKDALLTTEAHFKIIANSVPIVRYNDPPWLMATDRWQGYASQRTELLDFIADSGITNVWFLSGDFHTASVATVDRTGPHRFIWEINLGPGGNSGNPLWISYRSGIMQDLIAPPDQFHFFYGEPVAAVATFDPFSDTVSITFIDAVTEDVLFDRTISFTDVPTG
jgi:alkaline phosphatase D